MTIPEATDYCLQRLGMCAYHAKVIVKEAIADEKMKGRWVDPTDKHPGTSLNVVALIRAKYAWMAENCPRASHKPRSDETAKYL